MKVSIVTDTDSSLPAELAAKHGIRLVPQTVQFGSQSLEVGIDIDDRQLFARIDREKVMPTTAAPAPGKFAEAYRAAFDEGADVVICYCISGEMSGTYKSALAACDLFPGRDITVVDTRLASMAEGFMVLAAAEMAQQGAAKEEVLAAADELCNRSFFYVALPTLKYLAMSGRVGPWIASLAGALNVQPILTLRDGKIDILERVRTQKKAWRRVIEVTELAAGDRPIERMAVCHVVAEQNAHQFQMQICEKIGCPQDVILVELTPALSVHTGAGLVGVVVVTGK